MNLRKWFCSNVLFHCSSNLFLFLRFEHIVEAVVVRETEKVTRGFDREIQRHDRYGQSERENCPIGKKLKNQGTWHEGGWQKVGGTRKTLSEQHWLGSGMYCRDSCGVRSNSCVLWELGRKENNKQDHEVRVGEGTVRITLEKHWYRHIEWPPPLVTIQALILFCWILNCIINESKLP